MNYSKTYCIIAIGAMIAFSCHNGATYYSTAVQKKDAATKHDLYGHGIL